MFIFKKKKNDFSNLPRFNITDCCKIRKIGTIEFHLFDKRIIELNLFQFSYFFFITEQNKIFILVHILKKTEYIENIILKY